MVSMSEVWLERGVPREVMDLPSVAGARGSGQRVTSGHGRRRLELLSATRDMCRVL